MSTPRRYELTDFEWSIIQPLLPNKPRGKPRVDDRKVLNGIYWRLRTGSPWDDIPERYGPRPVRTGSGAGPRSASGMRLDPSPPAARALNRPCSNDLPPAVQAPSLVLR